jgi:nicotinamide riboside kinase
VLPIAGHRKLEAAMLKVAVLGAECTGKSTLVAALAEQLRAQGARVAVLDEYLRQWCADRGRTPRRDEQAGIVQDQLARLHAVPACDYLVCDTTPLITAVYSDVLFGDTSLYAQAVHVQRDFHLNLLADTDLPWQADGIQRDGVAVQQQVDQCVRTVLLDYGLAYALVTGAGTARLECAMDALVRRKSPAADALTGVQACAVAGR